MERKEECRKERKETVGKIVVMRSTEEERERTNLNREEISIMDLTFFSISSSDHRRLNSTDKGLLTAALRRNISEIQDIGYQLTRALAARTKCIALRFVDAISTKRQERVRRTA